MIKGIITPSITVFNKDRTIDYKGNERHINYLIDSGVNGILFLGSIGEFFAMGMDEKKDFISFALETVVGRVPVLIGTGGTVIGEVIELSQYAVEKGAHGVAVITPYFFQFNQETLYNYYKMIAENVEGNIYLYNFPDRTGVNMPVELIYQLARDFDNIKGIKDTMDSISNTREIITQVKEGLPEKDFVVYAGFDEYFLPNLLAGGDGLIGGLSNVVPALFAELYQAYVGGDFNTIARNSKKIGILMEIYKVSQPFFPAIKQAAALMGTGIEAVCKEPIKALNNNQIGRIKEIIRRAESVL